MPASARASLNRVLPAFAADGGDAEEVGGAELRDRENFLWLGEHFVAQS